MGGREAGGCWRVSFGGRMRDGDCCQGYGGGRGEWRMWLDGWIDAGMRDG